MIEEDREEAKRKFNDVINPAGSHYSAGRQLFLAGRESVEGELRAERELRRRDLKRIRELEDSLALQMKWKGTWEINEPKEGGSDLKEFVLMRALPIAVVIIGALVFVLKVLKLKHLI